MITGTLEAFDAHTARVDGKDYNLKSQGPEPKVVKGDWPYTEAKFTDLKVGQRPSQE